MDDLELKLKKLKVQMKQVDAAKEDVELKIAERTVDINRLKMSVAISEQKLKDLQEQIRVLEQESIDRSRGNK